MLLLRPFYVRKGASSSRNFLKFKGKLERPLKPGHVRLRNRGLQVTHGLALGAVCILCAMCILGSTFVLCQTFLHGAVNGEYHPTIEMSRVSANREAWHPQTREDSEEVQRELREILASPHFCNSKRYPSLLKYIVENTLAGRSDLLKERTLGVEVFDRPPTYDTNADTVVRYTAGEVRKRLLLYYSEHGKHSAIQISLPAGSYIPEFVQTHEEADGAGGSAAYHAPQGAEGSVLAETLFETQDPEHAQKSPAGDHDFRSASVAEMSSGRRFQFARAVSKPLLWLTLGALLAVGAVEGLRWRTDIVRPRTAVDDFWGPVLRDQDSILICPGGVVFQQNNFSGVITAGKDIEYPFVSMQIASAIAQVSGLVERSGATTELVPSPSTPLTALREHSIVLLGGYNNQWAMRLLQSQRIQFTPEPVESIVDRMQPEAHWSRDRSLPYSSADDYALIARFRDTTTDSWVVVLAGLGRNGSEAAAQFASSAHYMQLLREQMGRDFSSRNIEAVVKVSVIDGKTGAPSIVAVESW